jgi:hypothetical protein
LHVPYLGKARKVSKCQPAHLLSIMNYIAKH